MHTAEFDYQLPTELIAQHPAPHRDHSRLLILHRVSGQLEHRRFADLIAYLHRGDVLVLNDSKVIPARLRGRDLATGREFELLLLEENQRNDWWAMVRPGKRARVHTAIALIDRAGRITDQRATVVGVNADGHRRLQFENMGDIAEELERLGDLPLPPYIKREAGRAEREDFERYQTIYAETGGSVAAPTAGLHFTRELLALLRERGIEVTRVTLHVGVGTFAPVKVVELADHRMHEERFTVSAETVALINEARGQGRRIIAVGSTSLRALESAAADGTLQPVSRGRTKLFIHPPYRFKVVDALLTNFHLPGSTLLMLVSAFAAPGETLGCERIQAAYATAIQQRYRFFSYGDAMLLL